MNITENQAKELLKKDGVIVPKGFLITKPEQFFKIQKLLSGLEVVLKAQIHCGHRKKSGAILISEKGQAAIDAKKLLGMQVKGERVQQLLVEEKIDIRKEQYLACTIDQSTKELLVLYSPWGGVDFEEVVAWDPRRMKTIRWNTVPFGTSKSRWKRWEKSAVVDMKKSGVPAEISKLATTLVELLWRYDALLVEINPLAETPKGLVAADAKIVIDDNALFRQPKLAPFATEGLSALELKAKQDRVQYVELDGDIAVIGNGAGLVMATLDMIDVFGGKAANFLDVGGSGAALETEHALSIVLAKQGIRGLFMNIFGGITHCDEIAKGIIAYRKKHKLTIPIVLRMIGTREKEAKALLQKNGLRVFDEMEEAAKTIVMLATGKKKDGTTKDCRSKGKEMGRSVGMSGSVGRGRSAGRDK